jgi:D-threo-aldose 1-dehydrogenase
MAAAPAVGTRQFRTRSGAVVPFTELGFGSAPIGNLYHPVPEPEARATLEAAWEVGCRFFDTAPAYGLGLAETRLNPFLRCRRGERFVLSTKVGRILQVCAPAQRAGQSTFFDVPSRREVIDYSYDGVMRSLEQSFERLGVDSIDVLLCHGLDASTHAGAAVGEVRAFLEGGYRALTSLRDSGAVKAIGAGMNNCETAEFLARNGDLDIVLLAGRYTLLEQEALTSLLPLCVDRSIGVIIGGPYNSGILATGARPGAFYNDEPAPPDILDRTARLQRVCQSHGVALPEAALAFPLAHPAVLSVIPGAARPEEVRRNAANLRVRIPGSLWADLKAQGLLRGDAPVPS